MKSKTLENNASHVRHSRDWTFYSPMTAAPKPTQQAPQPTHQTPTPISGELTQDQADCYW